MNINKINNKISKILFLILFIILITTSIYKVNAVETENWDFHTLKTSDYLYCSEHGAPIAETNPEYKINGGSLQTTFPYGNIKKGFTRVSSELFDNWNGDTYRIRNNSPYTKIGESFATAAEAWILINGSGYSSPWQCAWWQTPAGKGYLHTDDGDVEGNQYYVVETKYASTEMFNADNRALATSGISMLDNFKEVNDNRDSNLKVAGKIVNFAAKEKTQDIVPDPLEPDVVPDPLVPPETFYENPSDKPSEVPNDIATEVSDFVKYIEVMTGKKNAVCKENGFVFTRKFEWINKDVEKNGKKIEYSNPTVAKNGDKFIVGPFAIDYVDMGKYSYMYKMKLEIRKDDGTTQVLEYTNDRDKNQFSIQTESKALFPCPNETFYIEFDSIKDATSIKNFMVDFKYMNATAKYSLWDASMTTFEGEIEGKDNSFTDANGNYIERYYLRRSEKKYSQNAQTLAKKESECRNWYVELELARGMEVVESCINIRKEITTEDGKEIDYDSLSEDLENRTFDFELTVNGANTFDNIAGEETKEILRVTAGKRYSTESRVYYWLKDNNNEEKVPTFTLKEIDKNGYTLSNISEIKTNGHGSFANGVFTGTLISDTTLNLKATNIIAPHKGNIKIIKELDEGLSEEVKELIKANNPNGFNVEVKITPASTGFFKYNGTYYGNKETNKVLVETVSVKIGESVTLPHYIEWYGEKAPTFEVEEKLTAEQAINIECKSITPKSGKLIDFSNEKDVKEEDKFVKVTIVNTSKEHKAKIRILKTVEISNEQINNLKNEYGEEVANILISKLMDKIKNQTFEFEIRVEGYEPIKAVIEKAEIHENTYVWKYTTDYFTWEGKSDEGPEYQIEEKSDIPGTVKPDIIKDKLKEKPDNNEHVIEHSLINIINLQEHHAKLQLNKFINTEELQDRDYRFDIELVSGIFTYKGKVYTPTENEPIMLTNDGIADENHKYVTIHVGTIPENGDSAGSWVSDTFKWYTYGTELVEKPYYKVNEYLEGVADVKTVVITPKEGVLDDFDSDVVVVKAVNNGIETLEGKLRIIKTLNDANRYDQNILKNITFECNILIDYSPNDDSWDGSDSINAVLKYKYYEEENKVTWEWESENPIASWKEGEDNPRYKVTEINLPEGTEFEKFKVNGEEHTEKEYIGELKPLKEPGTEETIEVYVNEVGVINKITPNNGKLAIKKEVTTASLKGREFEFDVTIEGTFKYKGKEYNNEKLTFTQSVREGEEPWVSDEFEWGAIAAPKYTVVEKESAEYECISMINNTGTLVNGSTVTAVFKNKGKETESAYLKLTKKLLPGQTSDKKFKFDITIDGKTTTVELKAGETYTSRSYTWLKTDPAPNYTIKEYSDNEAVLISLVERINGQERVVNDSNEISGTLKEGTTVEVIATNSINEKEGKFKVKKLVVADEKYVDGLKDKEFKITATISGNFLYGDNKEPHDGTLNIPITLKANQTWESPMISWYGDNAPTVTVKEDLTGQEYKGWTNIGISNNGAAISDKEVIELVVSNEYQIIPRLDLTVELAGDVWEDVPQKDSKGDPESLPNGRMDSSEVGIDGVEVYVYKKDTNELATIYKNALDAIQEQPIITSNNGHWDALRVKLTDEKDEFEVRFVYDGQTYENTEFLAIKDGSSLNELINSLYEKKKITENKDFNNLNDENKIKVFKGATNSKRNLFANTSMAKDIDREAVDSRINEIYGNSYINGLGNTIGKVNGSAGEQNVYYTSNASELGNQNKVISNLVTTDDDGIALDLFKATASTGNLTFPCGTNFADRFHLTGSDTNITDYGTEIVYHYSATYDYTKHINLGLKRRPESDVELYKDLVSANVVVNDRLTTYTFNKLSDLGKDILVRTYNTSESSEKYDLNYTLGLYKTDYYYRAEMYKTNMDRTAYDKLENFYKEVGGIDSTELEVYLQYRIAIVNSSSDKYDVVINSVDDYYDSTFKRIEEEERKYVKTSDGKVQEGTTVVAKKPKFEKEGFSSGVEINDIENGIKGSDGVTYNKIAINLNGATLKCGETGYINITYKVEKGTFKGVQDAIALGGKSNIAEVSNYSTCYKNENRIAGKIDSDSAPANIDIKNHLAKNWFEDDSYIAPVLQLQFAENDRIVSGIAWEDTATEESKKNGESVGNGQYDSNEALIGGLTTELVEKVQIIDEDQCVDYDFVWPTSQRLNSLGGMSLEELSGFDSIIETSRGVEQSDGTIAGVGEYTFVGAPAGDYVVRFVYGDDKTNLDSTMGMTGNATAYKADGTRFNENTKTSNYNGDAEGKVATVYNGQDYKSTIYQAGYASTDSNGYINNEWHNLDNIPMNENHISDARDSEARRLEVIANSKTITNANASVLETANELKESHMELYDDYYMFADTAKLNMSIENLDESDAVNLTVQSVEGCYNIEGPNSERSSKTSFEYQVPRIDFGLIERPKNTVVLDKEISSIKLTANDGTVVFNANYNITYELVDEGIFTRNNNKLAEIWRDGKKKILVANVTLDKDNSVGIEVLQALDKEENKVDGLDKNEGVQNFRFINVDDAVLQGILIEIDYKLTALNVSEKDYTSKELANISGTASEMKSDILNKANNFNSNNAKNGKNKSFGEYLGKYYYTGEFNADEENNKQTVTTTKVHQIVEYVDNDGVFSSDMNNTENQSWRATTANELAGNGFNEKRMVDSDITIINEMYDKNGRQYINDSNHNIALSIDSEANKGLVVSLTPAESENVLTTTDENTHISSMNIVVSKTISAQDDANNLTFDNIAEIVKFENSVGRRDMTAVPGNSNPKGSSDEKGEFASGLSERDSSATELVTFTPPTGIEVHKTMTSQVLIAIIAALGIVAVGIVVIKKKILTK